MLSNTPLMVKNTFINFGGLGREAAPETDVGSLPSAPFKRHYSEPAAVLWASEDSTEDRATDGGEGGEVGDGGDDTVSSLPPLSPPKAHTLALPPCLEEGGTVWARLTTAEYLNQQASLESWQRQVTADLWCDEDFSDRGALPSTASHDGECSQGCSEQPYAITEPAPLSPPGLLQSTWSPAQVTYPTVYIGQDKFLAPRYHLDGASSASSQGPDSLYNSMSGFINRASFLPPDRVVTSKDKKNQKGSNYKRGRFPDSLIDLAKRAQETGEPVVEREFRVAVAQRLSKPVSKASVSKGGCPSCGAPVKGHFRFCSCCGAEVSGV